MKTIDARVANCVGKILEDYNRLQTTNFEKKLGEIHFQDTIHLTSILQVSSRMLNPTTDDHYIFSYLLYVSSLHLKAVEI